MQFTLLKKTFVSLRNTNFRLFFTGQSISLLGFWIQQTALSWLIYDLTGSRFLLGFIAALNTFPLLFLSALGGVLADRYPKRIILIGTQLLAMVIAFILAFLAYFNLLQIWHIMLIAVVSGIIFAVDLPAKQAFMVDMVGKDDLNNAIALNSSIVNAARMIGPAIAGALMVKFNMGICFLSNALAIVPILMVLASIKLMGAEVCQTSESLIHSFMNGLSYVQKNRLILHLLLLMMVMGLFGSAYTILLPAIAKDLLAQQEKGYAMMVSFNGIGSLFGALFVAYLGNSKKRNFFVYAGLLVFCISIILLALTKNYHFSLILLPLTGFGIVTYFSTTNTIIQSSIEDEYRGRVMGISTLVFGGMIPLGNLLTGLSAQYFGLCETLIGFSIICILFSIILTFIFKKNSKNKYHKESKC